MSMQVSEGRRKVSSNFKAQICVSTNQDAHSLHLKPSRKFSSCADEQVRHNGINVLSSPQRKPDRVIGFGYEGIPRRCIVPAISANKHHDTFYPFLVFEAKSEVNSSLKSCVIQTAFPIWKFLRMQLATGDCL